MAAAHKTKTENTEKTKITVSGILTWVLGVFLFLLGLVALTKSVLGGVSIIIAALLCMPASYSWMSNKTKIELSKWLRVIAIIVLFVVGVTWLPTNSSSQTDSNANIQTTQPLSSLDVLNKTFKDIPTEWELNELSQLKLEQVAWQNKTYAKHFVEGASQRYDKSEVFAGFREVSYARISVYRLDSPEATKLMFDDFVTSVKDERGYTEITWGLPSRTNCFGYTREGSSHEICYKGNFVIEVIAGDQLNVLMAAAWESVV